MSITLGSPSLPCCKLGFGYSLVTLSHLCTFRQQKSFMRHTDFVPCVVKIIKLWCVRENPPQFGNIDSSERKISRLTRKVQSIILLNPYKFMFGCFLCLLCLLYIALEKKYSYVNVFNV